MSNQKYVFIIIWIKKNYKKKCFSACLLYCTIVCSYCIVFYSMNINLFCINIRIRIQPCGLDSRHTYQITRPFVVDRIMDYSIRWSLCLSCLLTADWLALESSLSYLFSPYLIFTLCGLCRDCRAYIRTSLCPSRINLTFKLSRRSHSSFWNTVESQHL